MGSMPSNCPLNGPKSRFGPVLGAARSLAALQSSAAWVVRGTALQRGPDAPPERVVSNLAGEILTVEKPQLSARDPKRVLARVARECTPLGRGTRPATHSLLHP